MGNWPSITSHWKRGCAVPGGSLTRGFGRRQRPPCSLIRLSTSSSSVQFTNITYITAPKANGGTWSLWAPMKDSPLRISLWTVMSPPQPGPRIAQHYRCTVGVKRCSSSTISCAHPSSMWLEAPSSPFCPGTPGSLVGSPRHSTLGMLMGPL